MWMATWTGQHIITQALDTTPWRGNIVFPLRLDMGWYGTRCTCCLFDNGKQAFVAGGWHERGGRLRAYPSMDKEGVKTIS
jgi:hypothetical protein